MNVMMLLEMAAQGFGERVAFQNGDDTLTYGDLYAAAGVAARRIRDSGCSHVATLDVSSLATPVILFGCAWAGVPYVPLNYRLTEAEIDALLQRVAPALLLTGPDRVEDFAGRPDVQALSREAFLADCRQGEPGEADWSMEGENIASLLFTSGTTGTPKAAILRQRHLTSYILSSVEFMSAGEEESALVSVPPYHIAGISSVLSSTYAGRRVVQLPDFNAPAWLDLAQGQGISHAFLVPTMLARIVEAFAERGDASLPRLRAIAYGGGKMALPVIERAMSMFPNASFANAYGLTETSSTISVLTPEDHRVAVASEDEQVRRRLISAGRPLPGLDVEIRDSQGRPVAAGVSGEIYVRGEQVSGEYVGKGSLLDADGWFATRDGGYIDSGGYLFVEGRADDVIVRGGENMSPGEIEDVLLQHEAVADAAVVGIPDEQWGEAVAAAVVCKPGAEVAPQALQDWVRQHMRSSRVPALVRMLDELPYNETGKLLRRVVRVQLAQDA